MRLKPHLFRRLTDQAYDTLMNYRRPLPTMQIVKRGNIDTNSQQLAEMMKRDPRFRIMERNTIRCKWGLQAWKQTCFRSNCNRWCFWHKKHCSQHCQLKTLHEGNITPQTKQVLTLISEGVSVKDVAQKFQITVTCVYGMCSRNGGVRKLRGDLI